MLGLHIFFRRLFFFSSDNTLRFLFLHTSQKKNQDNGGMDTTGSEHKLVFLNELHETLKRLDPRRVHTAGLFRILGR